MQSDLASALERRRRINQEKSAENSDNHVKQENDIDPQHSASEPDKSYSLENTTGEIYYASFLYNGEAHKDDLSFKVGDEIRIIEKPSNEWWVGIKTSDNTKGQVPATFVAKSKIDTEDTTTPESTTIQSPVKDKTLENKPCDCFIVDLGADFGTCKCGFRKSEHNEAALANRSTKVEFRRQSSVKDAISKFDVRSKQTNDINQQSKLQNEKISEDGVVDAPNEPVTPSTSNGQWKCDAFELDLSAPAFGTCKCGHLKAEHSESAKHTVKPARTSITVANKLQEGVIPTQPPQTGAKHTVHLEKPKGPSNETSTTPDSLENPTLPLSERLPATAPRTDLERTNDTVKPIIHSVVPQSDANTANAPIQRKQPQQPLHTAPPTQTPPPPVSQHPEPPQQPTRAPPPQPSHAPPPPARTPPQPVTQHPIPPQQPSHAPPPPARTPPQPVTQHPVPPQQPSHAPPPPARTPPQPVTQHPEPPQQPSHAPPPPPRDVSLGTPITKKMSVDSTSSSSIKFSSSTSVNSIPPLPPPARTVTPVDSLKKTAPIRNTLPSNQPPRAPVHPNNPSHNRPAPPTIQTEKVVSPKQNSTELICTVDYDATEQGYLSLRQGSKLTLVNKVNDSVWFVSSNGIQGLVPSSVVTMEETPPAPLTPKPSIDLASLQRSSPKNNETIPPPLPPLRQSPKSTPPTLPPLRSTNVEQKLEAIALFDFVGQEKDDLSFKKGDMITNVAAVDEKWFKGTCHGNFGIFPKTFVQVQANTHPAHSEAHTTSNNSTSQVPAKAVQQSPNVASKTVGENMAVATFDYQTGVDGDLNFKVGDMINVISNVDDNWLKGELNGVIGCFPKNFVKYEPKLSIIPLLDGLVPGTVTDTMQRTFSMETGTPFPPWYIAGRDSYSLQSQIQSSGNVSTKIEQYEIQRADRSIVSLTITQSSNEMEAKLVAIVKPCLKMNETELVESATSYGRSIVAFAEQRVGQIVGNGECWTLAAEAVKSQTNVDQAVGKNFGQKISIENAYPGDIIQFRECKFTFHNGSKIAGMPDHTAIVKQKLSKTNVMVYEQNPGPVKEGEYDFAQLTSGNFTVYRPIPKKYNAHARSI